MYLSRKFDNDVLDLVKQKGVFLYKYINSFEMFKENLPSKEKFHGSLTGKKIGDKEYEYVLNVWNKLEMKTLKDFHNLWIILKSLFKPTSFRLGCNAQYKNN